MMPSRGMHALKNAVPQIARAQRRNFSVARHGLNRSHLSHTSTTFRSTWRFPGAIASASLIRNASTTSTAVQTTPTTPLTSPPSSPAVSNIDTLSLDDIDFSTTAISATEKVGYLKEIGLDYGWGPSAVLEWIIEHFHVTAGLPWWAAIAAAGVTIRLFTIPLFIKSTEMNARTRALKPLTDPIHRKIQEYSKTNNKAAQQQETLKLMAVRRDAGIKMSWTFAPIIVQTVFGFCGFRILRAAAELPVPGFYTGGTLWFTDLTIPDGYLALPMMLAITTHLLIRLGGESGGTDQLASGVRKFLLYGMPPLTLLITGWQSAAMCVWFTSTTFMSLLTSLIIRSPYVRRLTGITQLAPRSTPMQPSKSIAEVVREIGDKPLLQTVQNFAGLGPRAEDSGPEETQEAKAAGQYRAPTAYSRPVYQAPRIKPTDARPTASVDTGAAQGAASVTKPASSNGSVVSNVGKATTANRKSRTSGAGRRASPRR